MNALYEGFSNLKVLISLGSSIINDFKIIYTSL